MYLDDLDDLLRAGVATLSSELRDRQRRFVLDRQCAGGGFTGRQGGADLYYTDFALRLLWLLDTPAEALGETADFVVQASLNPHDAVESFSALNAHRILKKYMSHPSHPSHIPLSTFRLPNAGFSRPGLRETSAYHTFLAALCYEMLSASFPDPAPAITAIARLKCPDGGYLDTAGAPAPLEGQTSATAAAVAFLTMTGALKEPDPQTVAFLISMQDADGGFRAWAGAPESDLLSTFTALVSLFALDGLGKINLSAAVRWVGSLADPEGGFRATPSDTEPDIEYTFYGLGTLALIRAYVNLMKALE